MIKQLALLATASLALAGCNKSGDNGATPATQSAPVAAVAPPAGSDWLSTVSATPDGGTIMGNPNAPVKLLEYGSLSCPHCKHFAEDSKDGLHKMIASGKVSYELRTFIIHPQDYALSLLAKCNGPTPFFAIVDQMFARQDDMNKAAAALTPADQAAWSKMSTGEVINDLAKKFNMVPMVGAMGVSADKANACLTDKAGLDQLQKMMADADSKYHISGTPTFIINGAVVADVNDWKALQPALKSAGVS